MVKISDGVMASGVEDTGIIKGKCYLCNKNMRYNKKWMSDSVIFSKSDSLYGVQTSNVKRIGFGHSIAVCGKCYDRFKDVFYFSGQELFNKLVADIKKLQVKNV